MGKRPEVDLFCEDLGHEEFARALLRRLAREANLPAPTVHVRAARGGHGRAISELSDWQRSLPRGATSCDILLVLIDANSVGWPRQFKAVGDAIDRNRFGDVVVAIPDPHIEAWAAADPDALRLATGAVPPTPPPDPDRGAYKRWLRDALEQAGSVLLTDPMAVSADIVPVMDLFRAGKQSPSLGHAVDGLRASLKRLAAFG